MLNINLEKERESEEGGYLEIDYFKKMAHVIVEVNKCKYNICKVGHKARNPEKHYSLCLKVVRWQNSLLLRGGLSFP